MGIGNNIYKLRTAEKMSQGDLADRLNVSRQSVSKWETDAAVPDLDKLMKLCDVFGVSLDEITGRVTCGRENTELEQKRKARPLKKSSATYSLPFRYRSLLSLLSLVTSYSFCR